MQDFGVISSPLMVCTGECKAPPKPTKLADDDDDVWGSDDEVSAYADLQRAHVNQGYLDGLTHAQEAGLQKGFDAGYPYGAELGLRVGRILARVHGSELFEEAMRALHITKVLDKSYFDGQLDMAGTHRLVSEWEQRVGILL